MFQPNGNIYPVIAGDVIGSGAHDLSQLIGERGRLAEQERVKMFQTLQYIMENLIYHITEIMVRFSGWGTSSTTSQKSWYVSLGGEPHLPHHRNHGTFLWVGNLICHITGIMVRFSGWGTSSATSQESWYVSLDGEPHLPHHRNHGTFLCHVPNATVRQRKPHLPHHRNHGTFFSVNVGGGERTSSAIVQQLCESRGGRPELSVLTSLLASVDVKIYCTVLRHWSQLVPNMSADI